MKKFSLVLILTWSILPIFAQNTGNTSIAMLNYLATEAQIIRQSTNNRLVLEDTYTTLINNTNPSVVDTRTQKQLVKILELIENFRIITLQRERLQLLLENSQAQAITQAMPNPLYLLGAGRDFNPMKLIATAAMMAIDSAFKYQDAKNEGQIEFLKGNWELDDIESAKLHELRMGTFTYMIDVSRDYKLSGSDTLNEDSINNFVNNKFITNIQRKKQFLESNRHLYAKYGPYWLDLADVYYNLEMYQECLNAVAQYESIQTSIFRKDYAYARILTEAIISASYIYKDNATYTQQATRFLQRLVANTTENQWAIRYFAAQTYISLANIGNKSTNLKLAYDLLLENIRVLSIEQEHMLDIYYHPINDRIPANLTKAQKEQTKKTITQLKEDRKKELTPFSGALWTSYYTLSRIGEELNISDNEWARIHEIIDEAFVPLYLMDELWERTKESYEQKDKGYDFAFAFSDGFFWRK